MHARRTGPRVALVYRGPAATDACAASAAALVRRARPDLDVRFTDLAHERLTSSSAVLYVQPGGGSLRSAWRHLRPVADDVRAYVDGGGVYLGLCLGGYLAGRTPGFGLFDGDTDRYTGSPGAELRHTRDAVLGVRWRGSRRELFFQDGPQFVLDDPGAGGTEVLARYANGAVAALVHQRGAGRVALVGPHPEATRDWFTDVGLPVPQDVAPGQDDPGTDLVRSLVPAPTPAW